MKKILENLKANWISYGFETIVIVIGIIGAFSLERWYEQYQSSKTVRALFEDVKNELLYDISELQWKIDGNNNLQIEAEQILNHKFNWDNRARTIQWYSLNTLHVTHKGYDELQNFSYIIPDKYDSVIVLLNKTYGRWASRIEESSKDIFYFQREYERLVRKTQWYNDIINGHDVGKTDIEYINNDPEFRNVYTQLFWSGRILTDNLKEFYALSIELAFQIKEILGDNSQFPAFINVKNSKLTSNEQQQYIGRYEMVNDHIDGITFNNGYLVAKRDTNFISNQYFRCIEQDLFVSISHYPSDSIKFVRNPSGVVIGFDDYPKAGRPHKKLKED